MPERSDLDILGELGVEPIRKSKPAMSPREARIIAGFEDIQTFVETHGHPPRHGEGQDIFERLYAVRLDRLKAQPDCVALLTAVDHQGLLVGEADQEEFGEMDDASLLEKLGVGPEAETDISKLQNVRSRSEIQAAEDIADRTTCQDFDKFAPLFENLKADLADGTRETRRFERKSEIEKGRFFIVDGLTAFVAHAEEEFTNTSGNRDRRLRVIFDNGTESNLLARSLQKALTQDAAGRRITEPQAGPLFAREQEAGGADTGTIYVLRSLSEAPEIASLGGVLHKIGVTGGDVARRFANAEKDPTFLLAAVEIVETFRLIDVDRIALENLLHRFFAPARLDVTIHDRFGQPVRPREWFLAPLSVIHEAVKKIEGGSLHLYEYRPDGAEIVPRSEPT